MDSFLASFSIFLVSILESGCKHSMHETASWCIPNVAPRVAAFYASTSLSGAFSGLLAAAINQINGKGGKPGWAWILILVTLCIDAP